jgi:hypothetical protein
MTDITIWKNNIAALNTQYNRLFKFDERMQCITDSSGFYYMYNYRSDYHDLILTWRLPNNMFVCWAVPSRRR